MDWQQPLWGIRGGPIHELEANTSWVLGQLIVLR